MTGSSFTIATDIHAALSALADGARPIAGGTDLVVGARQGKAPLPQSIVAIDRIPELAAIDRNDDGSLRIGSTVTHAQLMESVDIVDHYTAVADGAALVGSPATRHVGTLGGNVMNGSPAMDTGGSPLVVLDAEVELQNLNGSRRVTLDDLWVGPGRTSAAADELCVGIHLPVRAPRSGSAYVRLEYRRAMEIAVVGAAASVTLDGDKVAEAKIALTAVAPTIILVQGIEAINGYEALNDGVLNAVAEAAAEQASPISDLRASDTYRRHTVGVMARRAFEAAARRAAGDSIAVPVNRALGIGASA